MTVTRPPRCLTNLIRAGDRFQGDLDAEVDLADRSQVYRWAEQSRVSFDRFESAFRENQRFISEQLAGGMHRAPEPDDRRRLRELQEVTSEVERLFDIIKSQLIVVDMQASETPAARLPAETFDDSPALDLIERGSELNLLIHVLERAETDCCVAGELRTPDTP